MYGILRVFFTLFFKTLFRAKVFGLENVPDEGGVILAANHLSNWDPPFLATFLARKVSYMAKQELFDVPIFGRAIRGLRAFPVRRGASDRAAIKTAVAELRAGRCVGLFPEGTRSRDGKVHDAGAGVALIAALSGAPVVPAAIIGTNEIFSTGKLLPGLKVIYGVPLTFDGKRNDHGAQREFSRKLMDEIRKMKKIHSTG